MKKLVAYALSAALAFATPFALTACGQKDGTGDVATTDAATKEAAADKDAASETAPFATLGDVFAEDTESMSSTFDEQRYVCAFNWGGAWWRVEAALRTACTMSSTMLGLWIRTRLTSCSHRLP